LVVCCQPHLGWDQGLERSAVLAQGMAGKLMGSETVAKHSFVNREKCAAVLSVVIKDFENRFQDCKKIYISFFWFICNSIFSQHKYFHCEVFKWNI